ncbi:hypothetical protein ACODM8_04895 [Vibrio ostreicida]|uniref:Uncharacterized protein n=1 Tax=Vibrio ostreicida TaxID=526588 RepID=A0ABT8BYW5_9VIBR|nr:hypothetical protein [Vibrio ostreicida]MDN3611539.1 hypothetical protein [Vibrio ostreicida]NPD09033.1 hypothetical protein [Vibrio ostreicida]
MTKFQLGMSTLLDENAPEYLWIGQQLNQQIPKQDIATMINRCFGGNREIAEAMISVVEGRLSKFYLAEMLEKAPYSSLQ